MNYEKIPTYNYRLTEGEITPLPSPFCDFTVQTPFILMVEGELNLRKGYAWDGCTYFPDFKKLMRASRVHDALCQLINTCRLPSRLQKFADLEFRRIAIEDGFNKQIANIAYRAIRTYQTIQGKGGCAK